MHVAEWKKHIWKRLRTAWFPLYDTLEKTKLLRQEKKSVIARGCRERGVNWWRTEDIESSETILYSINMVDMYQYIFVKIHRMYRTESESLFNVWTLGDNDISL